MKRKNAIQEGDCFGLYVIQKRGVQKRSNGMCGVLTKTECKGCNFYKPIEKVIEEYKKYGYPTDR